MLDSAIISYTTRRNALGAMQRQGVSPDDFVEEYRTVWRWIIRTQRDQDTTPSPAALRHRFPDFDYQEDVRARDIPVLLQELRDRRRYMDFMAALNEAVGSCGSYDQIDDTIQSLQARLNSIGFQNGNRSHVVDLLSADVSARVRAEIDRRRTGEVVGIPTGLATFDRQLGGLQRQKMVVIIGRTSKGKTWLNLLFVANAVINGAKVILYPLEMSLQDTALRLYTLFSSQLLGVQRVFKNTDLSQGRVNPAKLRRFLSLLEDRFAGQLYVADVASLADPYTNERIEAEVDVHHPDLFWVDYLTLMKPPSGNGRSPESWENVRTLSNGIKNTAMRRGCVGGCSAQVNREALRDDRILIPRLEHIAYGDAIGQDADQVFSLARRGQFLYYSLVKNRGGAEIPRTKARWNVNEGVISEVEEEAGETRGDLHDSSR